MKVLELEKSSLSALREMAKELSVANAKRLKKEDLILRIQQAEAERQGLELRGGILEIMSEGIGFLRSGHYQPGPYDIYVSQSQIRRYKLRNGDLVIGQIDNVGGAIKLSQGVVKRGNGPRHQGAESGPVLIAGFALGF